MISPKATALLNRFTPAEVAERCVAAEGLLDKTHEVMVKRGERAIELEAEMAGMKLMEAEGDSFAETIVRQNEALEDDNAARQRSMIRLVKFSKTFTRLHHHPLPSTNVLDILQHNKRFPLLRLFQQILSHTHCLK